MNTQKKKRNKYAINTSLVKEDQPDGATIFDPDTSTLFTLNETASYILKLLEKNYSLERIINKIVTEYTVSESTAASDVQAVITEFKKNKILL